MSDGSPCGGIHDLIPELAAGAAAGDERARALRHLAGCAGCRRELAETADVFDELLCLAPEMDAPAGFEGAVLDRMLPRRRRIPWRGFGWAAALALTAGLAAGSVWWGTADDREVASSHRRTLAIAHGKQFGAAAVVPVGGSEIGTIFAYEGVPSWVYSTFRQPPAGGHYDVQLITKDGRRFPLRALDATPKTGGWGSRIGVRVRDIRAIEFSRSGTLLMTARFG